MSADYPAAHSMDTQWFAVDKNGLVGFFSTGAGGAVPMTAHCPEDPTEDLARITGRELDYGEFEGAAGAAGLFVFSCDDETCATPYERTHKPKSPLHIDQLPPDLRQAIGATRFEGIDYTKTPRLQPLELTESHSWDPAYLSSDGRTIRPVPGREDEYADFAEDLLGDDYIVEGLEDDEDD